MNKTSALFIVSVALKSPDIEITEESPEPKRSETGETPPVSPITSPYIPISECITGKSPVFDPKDINAFAEYNRRNSTRYTSRNNDSYEYHHPQNNYINYTNDPERNYVNDLDPKCYDSPRQLIPPKIRPAEEHSPLRSPTDSDSVFNEDDWVHSVPDKGKLDYFLELTVFLFVSTALLFSVRFVEKVTTVGQLRGFRTNANSKIYKSSRK